MKTSFLTFVISVFVLSAGTAAADPCKPVLQYINLGKKAEKCVSKIRADNNQANRVLAHYGYCTGVRETRDQVENHVKKLSATTLNSCAEKNLQAYSDAATAIQRLYQIELQLK